MYLTYSLTGYAAVQAQLGRCQRFLKANTTTLIHMHRERKKLELKSQVICRWTRKRQTVLGKLMTTDMLPQC